MHPPDGPKAERVLSIDIIRGFALIGMVMVHFMIYFGNEGAMQTWLYFSLNHLLGDWGASCFLILMGVSQVLSGSRHTDLDCRLLFKRALLRGVFIFIVGLVMLALTWGPYKIWQWDILTLMGFATVVLFFCRYLPSRLILLFAVSLAAATPFLRGQLAVAPLWNANLMPVPIISHYFPALLFDPAGSLPAVWSVTTVVRGFLFTGDFPVFPWLLFPLIGFVLGRRLIENKIRKDLPWLLLTGAILVCCGLGMGYAGSLTPGASVISGYIAPFSFYPDSFSMILLQLGISVMMIVILYYLYDIRGTDARKIGFFAGIFTDISHSSLTFYFLHYLLIGWPLAVIYVFSGKYYIYNLMGSLPAFICGLAAVGLLIAGLRIWERLGGKYKLEWFLDALIRRFA
ncbi:MAG: DUF1624 domain-containing protein [Deltaproteobacteria bacterium]